MPKSLTTADNTTDENRADHLVMAGADVLLKALEDEGVEVVFGYPGGAVLPIYDALFKNNNIKHILVRHEQAAVHAAEGYARSTGRRPGEPREELYSSRAKSEQTCRKIRDWDPSLF